MANVEKGAGTACQSHIKEFRSSAKSGGDLRSNRFAFHKDHSKEEGEWVTREEGS